jgi:Tfp pilus assembly protein PilN
MRYDLNLAIPPSARERYALHWAIPATVLGAAGLVLLLWASARSFREYRAVQKAIAGYQDRESALRTQETALRRQLQEPQSRAFLDNVQFVNTLIQEKQVSLTDLAADLAQLIPDEVRLTALAMEPDGEELGIRFLVAGKNEAALERFLSNLEDSPHFRDVAITNEGFEEAGTSSELENIACTAHYLVGGSEAGRE